MNTFTIECPNCQHEFQAEEAFTKHLNVEMAQKSQVLQKAFDEKNTAFLKEQQRLEVREQQLDLTISKAVKEKEEAIKRTVSVEVEKEFSASLDSYKKKVTEQGEQIKNLRAKEIEIEELKGKLADQGQELELKYKRQLNEKLTDEREKIVKTVNEDIELKMKEKEMMLEEARKQITDMQRKLDQGSTQLQGEAQELVVEERLKELFPYDEISEVAKGLRGADVMQIVHNENQLCGSLLYESKNTLMFGADWIDKLRKDQQACGASMAILVSKAMPKNRQEEYFVEKNVVVCSVSLFPVVASLCRNKLIELKYQAGRYELQKDTSGFLFQYLTSDDFRMHLEELVGALQEMKYQITKEKGAFEKQWKQRDKELDRMYSNLAQMFGSIKGIGGSSIKEIKSLEL